MLKSDFSRGRMSELSSSRGSGFSRRGREGKGFEEGEEWWGWCSWLRGAAKRRREKVCLRLPADSLKTERSILGVKSSVSALDGEGMEEHKERERSSGWERTLRSTTGIDSR